MTVSIDASSESHAGASGSTNEASFSWSHAGGGSPEGVLVFTFVTSSSGADDVTSVTYGGVSLTAVSGGRAVDTNFGDCKAWFLGASVPTGSQTVTVNRNNNSNSIYAVAATVNADASTTSVHTGGIVLVQGDATSLSEQSVTDGLTGGDPDSLRFAGAYVNLPNFNTSPPTTITFNTLQPGTNSTWLRGIDYGTTNIGFVRETTAGNGGRNVGFDAAGFSSFDRAAVHLAIKEGGGAAATAVKDLINGFGIMPFKR